jgi:hypothetical protein
MSYFQHYLDEICASSYIVKRSIGLFHLEQNTRPMLLDGEKISTISFVV